MTRAGTPDSRATQATPCAMLPALAVTTPSDELGGRRRAHRRVRAAQLEGADRVEALELEQDPIVRPQRNERRAEDVVADALARPADLLERWQAPSPGAD